MCHDKDDGYELLGQALFYANLPGQPAAGEAKVKDLSGREWDFKIPAGFRFQFVKDSNAPNGHGLLMKRVDVIHPETSSQVLWLTNV